MLKAIFFLSFFITINSSAIETKEIDNKIEITLSPKEKVTLYGKNEGTRHKRIALFNIDVYKAQLFVEKEFINNMSPEKLLNSKNLIIKITPLRSFKGDKLKEAMLVSYEKNNIDSTSPAQTQFLEILSKNQIKKNEPVLIVGLKTKEVDDVYLIVHNIKEKISGPNGFLKEVFSVWLGTPVDKDLEKLKEILLK